MILTNAQKHALENLERKRRGEDVPYINIASARTLTDLGLADRKAQGWEITTEGSKFLKSTN